MRNFFRKVNNQTSYFFNEVGESTISILRMPAWFIGPRFRFSLAVVNIVLLVVFVLQIADASGTGYELKKLEQAQEDISVEQQKIDVEIAAINSLAYINAKMENSSMVISSRLKYVKVPVASVAVITP
jgi:hypothetical protein